MNFKSLSAMALCLGAFHALTVSADEPKWLHYEPEVVTLTGRLILVGEFGPPNYGEDPSTDEKALIPEIELAVPVNVKGNPSNDLNITGYQGVRRIQLSCPDYSATCRPLVGNDVKAIGTLYQRHTGHHYTPVLLSVQNISRLDSSSAATPQPEILPFKGELVLAGEFGPEESGGRKVPVLELAAPAEKKGALENGTGHDGPFPIHRVQLLCAEYEKLCKPLVGKRVEAAGVLYNRGPGDYYAPMVLDVKILRAGKKFLAGHSQEEGQFKTIEELIKDYVPAGERSVSDYQEFIHDSTGLSGDERIDTLSEEQKERLMDAIQEMEKREGGEVRIIRPKE
ncbi:MAG: DUF4431 domain-containing protein [Bdellovibrionota bacterium]